MKKRATRSVVLVGNYAPDAQQSMLRFGRMLEQGLQHRGVEVAMVQPSASRLAGWVRRRQGGAALKWAGYFDKYVRFPSRLKTQVRAAAATAGEAIIHVVDHSNAVYIPGERARGSVRWLVTCHDLLAVRGAMGEDTDCPATRLGRRLQQAIVRGLGRAAAIACDSTSTLHDVERIVPGGARQVRRVILLGLSHPYQAIGDAQALRRLAAAPGVPWDGPYLIHVGSNLGRKNKAGVLRVLERLRGRWDGNLVFCGAELTPELRQAAAAKAVADRVFVLPAPDNALLEAAYARAHALLFPSKCEGFGWPVIEAQACGCPVICSDRTSLPEVGGDAALVHALEDEAGMAESVLKLADPAFRAGVVARGQANLARFEVERMIDAYLELYEEVLAGAGGR